MDSKVRQGLKIVFTSIGFIIFQFILCVIALSITSEIMSIDTMFTVTYAHPYPPYLLQNISDSLNGFLSQPQNSGGVRLIISCIAIEGLYWFVRKIFFANKRGVLSIVRYLTIPAVLPLLIYLYLGNSSGGFLPSTAGTIFFNLSFIWLIIGLVIRGVLSFLDSHFVKLPANIFAVAVLGVCIVLIV